MKKILVILLSLSLFVYLFIGLLKSSKNIAYHTDEVSWFFHTDFFNQLFLERNLDKSFWESYESFDHPPLSKYIFGAYLYLKEKEVFIARDSLEDKYGRWMFYFKLDNKQLEENFSRYLNYMREANMIFTVASLVFVFLILYKLSKSLLISLALPLVLSVNNLFTTTMLRATSDAHYVAFMLVSIFLYLAYLKEKKLLHLVLFALFAGLSVSSKLTGALVYISYLLSEAYFFVTEKEVKENIKRLFFVFVIWFFVWWVQNPSIYLSPIANTIAYPKFRYEQSIRLQKAFPEVALINTKQRLKALGCTFLGLTCVETYYNGRLTNWLVINLAALIAGIYFLALNIKRPKNKNIFIYFFLFALSVVGIVGGYLPLNSDRYYLPILIVIFTLQFMGIGKTIELFRARIFDVYF